MLKAEEENLKAIHNTIERVVRATLHSGDIIKVTVERDEDAEGGDILAVTVIFDGKRKSLDAKETSQLARHVWRALVDMDVQGFPSFSFIEKSEAGKLAAA
jgi:hypothetical protein